MPGTGQSLWAFFCFFASKTNVTIDFMRQCPWVGTRASQGTVLGRLWVMFLFCFALGFKVASSMLPKLLE